MRMGKRMGGKVRDRNAGGSRRCRSWLPDGGDRGGKEERWRGRASLDVWVW